MQLNLGNGDIELQVSFYTLVVYEQQFHSDMIADFIGKVRIVDSDEEGVYLDYSTYNWIEATKAMWAAAKCANNDIEPYEQWCKNMTNVNMWPIITDFRSEVLARLFRAGATDSE